jgi:hypothetical protein
MFGRDIMGLSHSMGFERLTLAGEHGGVEGLAIGKGRHAVRMPLHMKDPPAEDLVETRSRLMAGR